MSDERAGVQLDEGGESAVDFAFGARPQDPELQIFRARRVLHGSNEALDTSTVGSPRFTSRVITLA